MIRRLYTGMSGEENGIDWSCTHRDYAHCSPVVRLEGGRYEIGSG